MRFLKWGGWGLGVLAGLAALAWVWLRHDHPRLEPYEGLLLPPRRGASAGVRVIFLGVASVLVEDGETALLTDGFFSRPGVGRSVLGRVRPEPEVIAHGLERAGIHHLAAVLVGHSHYDHALDSPTVALDTGALLVGSESTANLGRGAGLSEERLRVVVPGEPMRFGRFTVTFLRSRHSPTGFTGGEVTRPLVPPARATDYLEGGTWSVLIEHEGQSLLVQSSAGFVEGALQGRHADVVLLGIGTLGKQDEAYREAYWRETVRAVGARRVIPIHWDDFWRPLDEPLVPMPRVLDDFDTSMTFLLEHGHREGIDVRLLPVWVKVDPFAVP